MFFLLAGMYVKIPRRTFWEKMETGTMIFWRAVQEENVVGLFFFWTWEETEERKLLERFTVKGKGGSGGQRGEWIVLLTLHWFAAMDVVGWFWGAISALSKSGSCNSVNNQVYERGTSTEELLSEGGSSVEKPTAVNW